MASCGNKSLAPVGNALGNIVVGTAEGDVVGSLDGTEEGAAVGEAVGDALGAEVVETVVGESVKTAGGRLKAGCIELGVGVAEGATDMLVLVVGAIVEARVSGPLIGATVSGPSIGAKVSFASAAIESMVVGNERSLGKGKGIGVGLELGTGVGIVDELVIAGTTVCAVKGVAQHNMASDPIDKIPGRCCDR
jgi:hypothetical protein